MKSIEHNLYVVVSGRPSDPDDEGVAGVYLVSATLPYPMNEAGFVGEADLCSSIAGAVLDEFHDNCGISTLDDFSIEVYTEGGLHAFEGEAKAAGHVSADFHGKLNRCDVPATLDHALPRAAAAGRHAVMQYRHSCVDVNDGNTLARDQLIAFIDTAKQVKRDSFKRHVDQDSLVELEHKLGYVTGSKRGLRCADDYTVSYLSGTYAGKRAVAMVHSRIEHIFCAEPISLHPEAPEPSPPKRKPRHRM